MVVDPACITALAELRDLFKARNVLYAVIGGVGLQLWAGPILARTTNDVDVAILVDNLGEHDSIMSELVSRGWRRGKNEHSIRSPQGCNFDLLPYPIGGVKDDRFVWPRSRSPMTVTGMAEAITNSREVRLSSKLELSVALPEYLAALKAVAWVDRGESRDAFDLVELCRRFGDDDMVLRLVVSREAESAVQARAVLLGRRVAEVVPAARKAIKEIGLAISDPHGVLVARLRAEFYHERPEAEYQQEVSSIGQGLVRGVGAVSSDLR